MNTAPPPACGAGGGVMGSGGLSRCDDTLAVRLSGGRVSTLSAAMRSACVCTDALLARLLLRGRPRVTALRGRARDAREPERAVWLREKATRSAAPSTTRPSTASRARAASSWLAKLTNPKSSPARLCSTLAAITCTVCGPGRTAPRAMQWRQVGAQTCFIMVHWMVPKP